jgi:hypothetical protein
MHKYVKTDIFINKRPLTEGFLQKNQITKLYHTMLKEKYSSIHQRAKTERN